MSDFISREAVVYQLAKQATIDGQPRAIKRAAKIVADFPAADVASGRDYRDCRNELCLRCGQYKEKHLGACKGCRWEH